MNKKEKAAKTIFIILLVAGFIYLMYLQIPYSRSGGIHQATNLLYKFTWEEDGITHQTDQMGEATYFTPLQYEIKKCYGNQPKNVDYPVKRVNSRTVSDLKISNINVIHYRVARLGIFDKTDCFGLSEV